ncbi:MAG: hypothetical protein KAJ63_04750, partial [Methyloprofundus sp.]|nr:hypothetical protein [Methyloprofundus sp.]
MKQNTKLISMLVVLGLSGCAADSENKLTVMESELDQVQQENERLAELNRELATSNTEIQSANAVAIADANARANATRAGDDLLPPNAKPGECYARILIPEKYEMTTSRMLKSAATERVEIIPATYTMVDKRVLVKE